MNISMSDFLGGILTHNAITTLNKNIEEFNKKASRQTSALLLLTVIITALTFFMLVGLVIQIWLVLR